MNSMKTRHDPSPPVWNVCRSELRIRLLLVRPRTEVLDRTLEEEVGRWMNLMEADCLGEVDLRSISAR